MTKKKMGPTDEQKIKVIEKLLADCSRHNEWVEAALLHAIERVMTDVDVDLSSDGIKRLLEEAEDN